MALKSSRSGTNYEPSQIDLLDDFCPVSHLNFIEDFAILMIEVHMEYKRELQIEEMPQGCIVSDGLAQYIVISSPADALAIIASLKKMLDVQYPELVNNEKDAR
jgi:hypothetical protein